MLIFVFDPLTSGTPPVTPECQTLSDVPYLSDRLRGESADADTASASADSRWLRKHFSTVLCKAESAGMTAVVWTVEKNVITSAKAPVVTGYKPENLWLFSCRHWRVWWCLWGQRSQRTVAHQSCDFHRASALHQLTITKEYPVHSALHLLGHSGMSLVWLWTAITLALASQTAHLDHRGSHDWCQSGSRPAGSGSESLWTRRLPADVAPQGVLRHDALAAQLAVGGEPVGVVVAWCVATGAVGGADQEGHGAELLQAAAQRSCRKQGDGRSADDRNRTFLDLIRIPARTGSFSVINTILTLLIPSVRTRVWWIFYLFICSTFNSMYSCAWARVGLVGVMCDRETSRDTEHLCGYG